MTNKKILIGILAAFLVLGISISACAQDNGVFTLTNIPEQYNGTYAVLYGGNLYGADEYNWKNTHFFGREILEILISRASRISNGRVRIPMWQIESGNNLIRYSGNHVADQISISIGIPTSDSEDGPIVIGFSSVGFTRGSATRSFNDAQIIINRNSINVWSFSEEVERLIKNYYSRAVPNVGINYYFILTDQFQNRLDPALASGRGTPDVFTLEAAFVRKYVESGLLLDLTDVYERNRHKLLSYPVEIGSYMGRVYALSWQATPGAFFYRRSIARKYFGTDDPVRIQELVKDFNTFMQTAERLRQASNGQAVMLASRDDLRNVFLCARSQPWVVRGRLTIDPVMIQYMEMMKTFHENGYDARVNQWSDGWFRTMRDEEQDTNGRPYEAFGYFLPTWGLHYVLKTNAERTAGDWAMVAGPAAYHWGGTWLAAWRGTQRANEVKQMIEWLTTNDAFLEQYALESGDVVSNTNVLNRVAPYFSEPFLNGQNHYAEIARFARNIDGRLSQGTDEAIYSLFNEQVEAYVMGRKTRDQALNDFRQEVASALGIN